MTWLIKGILAVYFVLVILPVAFVRRLMGRDTLQLMRPPDGPSCWISRVPVTDTQSYFSEESMAEGKPSRGAARFLVPPLMLLAKICAPSRKTEAGKGPSAADREKDIPDEIYTLW